MEQSRDPIANSIREHADGLDFGNPPTGSILAAGTQRRRRRVALVSTGAAVAAATIAAAGWWAIAVQLPGEGDTGPPVATPANRETSSRPTDSTEPTNNPTSEDTQWPPEGVRLTECADIPRIADVGAIDDFTVDTQNGILSFAYPTEHGERNVDIAYRRDEGCRNHPDISELITRVEQAIGSAG